MEKKIIRDIIFIIAVSATLSWNAGCAHHKKLPPESVLTVYSPSDESQALFSKHAPLFLAYGYKSEYNRIGKPKARKIANGNVEIYVDHREPAVFTMKREFTTAKGKYVNLIYRVHFPEIPFSLIPFNLTAGENAGLMVVITLDDRQKPVLTTTVHTCGCYLAIVPTSSLPEDSFPENWKNETMSVYGEKLPPLLDFKGRKEPRLLVALRPQVHRVMNLAVVEAEAIASSTDYRLVRTEFAPVETLEKLPSNGGVVSFYHEEGLLQGHVKGSVKPWETLLLSLISLDLFVGTDKAYDDPEKTENPFYTSLKPWNRDESNMWYFERFLEFWGWRL